MPWAQQCLVYFGPKCTKAAVWKVKSCQISIKLPKNDFTTKMKDFDNFTKIDQNVGNLGKIIDATCFEKLPKVQYIAQSGHTVIGR